MLRYLNLIKSISNWQLHFLNKLGLYKNDPFLFKTRNGIKIEVPKRLYHEFKEIFMENAYSVGLRKNVGNKPIIIDIGANVGFFTMFAVSKYPGCTIYAFEPIHFNYEGLLKNKKMNNQEDIHIFNKAVCGYSGKITMNFEETESYTTSASIIKNITDNHMQSIEVPCLTLCDIFTQNQLTRCDLLKMDCEGAEYDILYNTPKEIFYKIDQMAIEVHAGENKNENLPALKDFLLKFDFKLFQLNDNPHMLWAYRT